MKVLFCCRRISARLLPLLAVSLFGVQLLGVHIHLHGEHHDQSGGHVHSVHSPCHAHAEHPGDSTDANLWQALLGKLPDSYDAGATANPLLVMSPLALRLNLVRALDPFPPRQRLQAHFTPLLRAPPH